MIEFSFGISGHYSMFEPTNFLIYGQHQHIYKKQFEQVLICINCISYQKAFDIYRIPTQYSELQFSLMIMTFGSTKTQISFYLDFYWQKALFSIMFLKWEKGPKFAIRYLNWMEMEFIIQNSLQLGIMYKIEKYV